MYACSTNSTEPTNNNSKYISSFLFKSNSTGFLQEIHKDAQPDTAIYTAYFSVFLVDTIFGFSQVGKDWEVTTVTNGKVKKYGSAENQTFIKKWEK